MSAPDTDLEEQAIRHLGPIIGITSGPVFVALLALAVFIWPGIPLDPKPGPDDDPVPTFDGNTLTGLPSIVSDTKINISIEEIQ